MKTITLNTTNKEEMPQKQANVEENTP